MGLHIRRRAWRVEAFTQPPSNWRLSRQHAKQVIISLLFRTGHFLLSICSHLTSGLELTPAWGMLIIAGLFIRNSPFYKKPLCLEIVYLQVQGKSLCFVQSRVREEKQGLQKFYDISRNEFYANQFVNGSETDETRNIFYKTYQDLVPCD